MSSIKEKVNIVRNVVTGYSNHEIVLVLQHYDEDVDLAIADFMFPEKIKAILTEWQSTGPMKAKKKKKKKAKKSKQQPETINGQIEETPKAEEQSPAGEKLVNGTDQTSKGAATALKMMLTEPVATKTSAENGRSNSEHGESNVNVEKAVKPLHLREQRIRTSSEASSHSQSHKRKHQRKPETGHGNVHPHTKAQQELPQNHLSNRKSIEKSVRDLQRCTVSFGRYRNLLNDEINESYKRIKQAFEELSNAIMDREVVLFRNLDEIKEEAFLMLSKREARAAQLKQQTDRVDNMNPHQLSDLRNDIKQFVADRKFDEEIGRTTRFAYDKQISLNVIPEFGEICDNKNLPPLISRIRTESTVSYTSEASIPPTPSPTIPAEKEEKKERVEKRGPIKREKFEKKEPPSSNGLKLNLKQRENGVGKKSKDTNSMVASNWADECDHLVPLSPLSWANELEKAANEKPKEKIQSSYNKPNINRSRSQQNRYPDNREKKTGQEEDQQLRPKFKTNQQKSQPQDRPNHNSNDSSSAQRNPPKRGFGRGSGDSVRGGYNNRYRGNFRGPYRGGRGRHHTPHDSVPNNSSNNYRNNSSDGQQTRNNPKLQTTESRSSVKSS